jgi:hypothetical protein
MSVAAKAPSAPGGIAFIQRKCACGGPAGVFGECEECGGKKALGLQRRLVVGVSNDPLEREADRVADQVTSGSAPRAIDAARPYVRRLAGISDRHTMQAPANVHRVLASSGTPLAPGLRRDMEQRFGHDFSRVRLHTDAEANRSARDIRAEAYTSGSHIVFASGFYRPSSAPGLHLLAHELTHVLQQSGGSGGIQKQSDSAAQRGGPTTVGAVLSALQTASTFVPGLAPLVQTVELVRAVMFFWEHRQEHLQQLLDSVGATIDTIPALARARLAEFLAAAGTGRDAAACVGSQLLSLLESLATNWRATLGSFVRDFFFVGLFERSIPTIIAQSELLFQDILGGEFRSAIDRGIAITTEINAIAGVLYLWFALISTIVGAAAGTEAPVAGNAVGAAAGLTVAQVVNIGLIASVVATETTRVGRGIDDMIRFWDDVPARERGCREVAEGVFSLALTGALFYFGPQIQRFARSIISQAVVEVRAAVTAATREAAVVAEGLRAPQLVTPEGLRFAGPEPSGLRGPSPARPAPVPKPLRAPPRPVPPAEPRPAPTPAPAAEPAPTPARAEPAPAQARGPATALEPVTEEPTRRVDLCRDTLGLLPGVHARWNRQRPPINGDTTVDSAAFRLDAGRTPPSGQRTTPAQVSWVRSIGHPKDDAGHVIAFRFGGTRTHNSDPGGNIFPQNLTYNRGPMVVRDREAAQLHAAGCDVCVHILLEYASATELRPSESVHTIMVRYPRAPDFVWLGAARITNP